MNILVVNGPNLNLLGSRETKIYGTDTLEKLMMCLQKSPDGADHSFKFLQSNHEGEIIDVLHDERHWANGVIINPGALTHYSYSIRDAISAINIPTVEVNLSDIHNREEFRNKSLISDVVTGIICGLGTYGYILAINSI